MKLAVEIRKDSKTLKSFARCCRLRSMTSTLFHRGNGDRINVACKTPRRIVDTGKHEKKLDSLEIANLLGADLVIHWGMIEAFDKNLFHIIFREGTDFHFREKSVLLKNGEDITLLPIQDVSRILDEETVEVLWKNIC